MLGSVLNDNKLYALNSARCLMFNVPYLPWHFLGALYYTSRFFGFNGTFESIGDSLYPYICTCSVELDHFGQYFGSNDYTNEVMGECTSDLYNF